MKSSPLFCLYEQYLGFSPDLHCHVQLLQDGMDLYCSYGLIIGLGKSKFVVPGTEFLGQHLCSLGVRPLKKHTTPVCDFPLPSGKAGLQLFLGMINFNQKFN